MLPRWPIAVLLLGAAVAAAIAWRARDSRPGTKFGHSLDVFRVLGRCPRAAARIAGWVGLSMGLRVLAATGIAAAFGIDRPLAAAVLIIPALDLAGILHPTAAVCGTPRPTAMARIRAVEGMDRGRYSGPVGWVDAAGNGELMVLPIREAREHFERAYLQAQLERFSGNISRTASFVGMERSALHRKLKSLNIHTDD